MNALDLYTNQQTAGVQISPQVGGVQIGAAPAIRETTGQIQRIMAGIPIQSIAAGGSAEITVTVSEPFRPERLVFSTAAQALDLNNLRIGTKSLNVTSNPISGNCFAEDAIGTHVVGYTSQGGVGFVLSLVNNTAGAVSSGGGCFGLALN